VLAQLLEPPCTDPYARWCGRGGAARLPPIPINQPSASFLTCSIQTSFSGKRAVVDSLKFLIVGFS
jgi:hypothetical protein